MPDQENEEGLDLSLHEQFVDALEGKLQGEPTAADLGVALQYMKAVGIVATVAAKVAQDPKGPVALGVGRVLPFAEQAEDPDAMAQ